MLFTVGRSINKGGIVRWNQTVWIRCCKREKITKNVSRRITYYELVYLKKKSGISGGRDEDSLMFVI